MLGISLVLRIKGGVRFSDPDKRDDLDPSLQSLPIGATHNPDASLANDLVPYFAQKLVEVARSRADPAVIERLIYPELRPLRVFLVSPR